MPLLRLPRDTAARATPVAGARAALLAHAAEMDWAATLGPRSSAPFGGGGEGRRPGSAPARPPAADWGGAPTVPSGACKACPPQIGRAPRTDGVNGVPRTLPVLKRALFLRRQARCGGRRPLAHGRTRAKDCGLRICRRAYERMNGGNRERPAGGHPLVRVPSSC